MIKKGIVSLVCCLFVISFLPVLVFAESATYVEITPGECWSRKTGGQSAFKFVQTVRIVRINNTYYVVSETNELTGRENRAYPTSCDFSIGTPQNLRNNLTDGHAIKAFGTSEEYFPDVPVIIGDANTQNAVYYTWGEGAVDPVDPVNWGILRDVKYNTAVAGSGYSAFRNVDYINWNNAIDANDNDISECQVEIQAVPGNWTGTTKEDLLTKGVDAFTIGGVYSPVTLGTVSASVGTFSISWQGVINQIGWPFDSLYAKLEGTQWLKNGWYYQIRLLGSDGYVGSWQTIYNLTSGSAAGSENIINHNEFNTTTNSYLQTITQINNQETVTITYNDTAITIENPDVNPEPEGGINLWDLLKQLINGIFQLLAKLGDIAKAVINFVADLLDGLLDLIKTLILPPESISNEYNTEINNNINNYIEQNQPGLVDSKDIIESAQTKIENYSAMSGSSCILEWEDVDLDLTLFGAGRVVFIPGGQYDFGTAFNNLLEGAGISYSTYQTIVSAVIYISLVVLISRKITGFLKKS